MVHYGHYAITVILIKLHLIKYSRDVYNTVASVERYLPCPLFKVPADFWF